MIKNTSLIKALLTITLLCSMTKAYANFNFSSGNIFSSNWDDTFIYEYFSSGTVHIWINPGIDAGYTRDLAFGPDGLLYAVAKRPNRELLGFTVYALDDIAFPVKSWTNSTANLIGYPGYGDIEFDANGFFYVGFEGGILKFDSANQQDSGAHIFSTTAPDGIRDLKLLPSGEIIAVTADDIYHLDSSGNIINHVTQYADPSNLIESVSNNFNNISSIAYDADSDTLLVYHSGSGGLNRLMRLSPTAVLLNAVTLPGVIELNILPGNLILASILGAPPLVLDNNLSLFISTSGPAHTFFTIKP